MSELIVFAFSKKNQADEVVLDALKQDGKVIEGLEDVVVLTKNKAGKIRVKPYYDLLPGHREIKSEFWGVFISTVLTGFDNEVHERLGITREDIVKLREMLEPDSSVIFVLRQKFKIEQLIDNLQKYQGKLLHLFLNQETERELLDVMTPK